MADHYCTYFDVNYLPRALAMYHSLQRWSPEAILHVLTLDLQSAMVLMELNLAGMEVLTIADLEVADSELAATKGTRSRIEYYFTCGPAFILHTLRTHLDIELLTYIDADTFFYSDPSILLKELSGSSIGVTVHRFNRSCIEGNFNVGWITFRRDKDGMDCASWWRARCVEWCYERFEDGKYADQKYLDEWPTRFKGVKVIQNRGANVAPWNVRDYRIQFTGRIVTVDGEPLVFFHFHRFRQITPWLYNTNLGLTFRFPSRILIKQVYSPYISAIKRNSFGLAPTANIPRKNLRHQAVQTMRNVIRIAIGIVFRQYVIVVRDRVF